MYWLNYLDRNAIALARLNDLEEDLALTGSQYQTCVSILFVGYILAQVPSNLLITRVKPRYYMSFCMSLWAVVSALTALSKGYIGLLLTRFFLGKWSNHFEKPCADALSKGIVEAPYYPGALYLLGLVKTPQGRGRMSSDHQLASFTLGRRLQHGSQSCTRAIFLQLHLRA